MNKPLFELYQTRSSPKRGKYYIASALILIIAGILLGLHYLTQPKQGVVNAPAVQNTAKASEPTLFEGNFFNIMLPAAFEFKQQTIGGAQEGYIFLTGRPDFEKLAVSILNLPNSGDWQDNDAYKLRTSQPELYTQQQSKFIKAGTELFLSADLKEYAAFIPAEDRLAVMVISTSGSLGDNSRDTILGIVNSFEWKQTSPQALQP